MASKSTVLPLFVSGNQETIEAAVAEGGVLYTLDSICYGYGKDTGKLCYIDLDHNIHWIVGNNKPLVQRVDALPATGDADVLYILGTTVYQWDPLIQAYVPTYKDVSDQLEALTETVQSLSGTVTGLAAEVAQRPTYDEVNTAISSAVNPVVSNLNSLTNTVQTMGGDIETVTNLATEANTKVDATVANVETLSTSVAEIAEQSGETSEKVDEVAQEAKDYTDQKNDDLRNYVDTIFELKEV